MLSLCHTWWLAQLVGQTNMTHYTDPYNTHMDQKFIRIKNCNTCKLLQLFVILTQLSSDWVKNINWLAASEIILFRRHDRSHSRYAFMQSKWLLSAHIIHCWKPPSTGSVQNYTTTDACFGYRIQSIPIETTTKQEIRESAFQRYKTCSHWFRSLPFANIKSAILTIQSCNLQCVLHMLIICFVPSTSPVTHQMLATNETGNIVLKLCIEQYVLWQHQCYAQRYDVMMLCPEIIGQNFTIVRTGTLPFMRKWMLLHTKKGHKQQLWLTARSCREKSASKETLVSQYTAKLCRSTSLYMMSAESWLTNLGTCNITHHIYI